MVVNVFLLVIWGLCGLMNILSKGKKVDKVNYFLIWISLIVLIIGRIFG